MRAPRQRRKPTDSPSATAPAFSDEAADAGEQTQFREDGPGAVAPTGPGQALPSDVRAMMEARFGHDFGAVRIFADDDTASTAHSLQARAFTIESDIGFGRGQYAPDTPHGRGLIAHELTHVVQSRYAAGEHRALSETDDPAEREAAGLALIPGLVTPMQAPSALIQRDSTTTPTPPPVPTAVPPSAPAPGPPAQGGPPAPVPSGQKPPPVQAALKFDDGDINVLELRAKILDGIKPSVLADNKYVGDVFGLRVELTGEELEPARDKVRVACRAKFGDIKKRSDRAYLDYKAEYNYRANMPFSDRALWDLAHTNFFGGPNAASPNPLDRDPGDKIEEIVNNVDFHIEKVEGFLKTNDFGRAVQYLTSAEKGSYNAVRPLVQWKEQDLKGAENTIAQLEAIKFASDVALVALGGLGGISMAKTAGNIAMGQALATQGLLIAAKYAAGDKIDWKKEGIQGIMNVVLAKFGNTLSNSLAKKLAASGATTLSEEMANKIIAALIVHEGSTVLQTSVQYVYEKNFESGGKPASWEDFFNVLLAHMTDPKGVVLAVLGAAVQSAADFKPNPNAGKPGGVDVTTNDSVRARTGTILSKGGPEAVGLARSVIVEEKNFYTVRTLASERGTWGTSAQGPLEQARQEAINSAISQAKGKAPNTDIEKSGGGFINPYVITVRAKGAAPANSGGGAPNAPSPMAQSSPPPGAGGSGGPPSGAGTGAATAQPGAQDAGLKAAWQKEAIQAWADIGQYLQGVPFRPSELMSFAMSLDTRAHLELGPDLDPVVMGEYGGMAPKLDEARFEFVKKIGGDEKAATEGLSEKMVLRDKESGEEYLFKPQEGDARTAHEAHAIMPGSYMARARAAYGIGLQMPSVMGSSPTVGVVEYRGKLGSLQKWVKGTRSLNELYREDPKLCTEVTRSPEFKKFKANLDAYDYVVNSVDRNPGNVLVKFAPDGKTVEGFIAIDHDLTLTPGMRIVGGGGKAAGVPAKISRATYNELLGMKANEAAIKDGLTLTLNPEMRADRAAKIDGIFERLDTMLNAFDAQQKKGGHDSIFLD